MSEDLVRASDADRDRTVASLREHLVHGRLSLEEFTHRMGAAYAATTSAELAALERDLPAASANEPERRRRRGVRFLFSIFGSTRRGGSLRVRGTVLCVAVFGSVTLDLRGALLAGDTVNILAATAFGSVDVIVPKGVEVDLTGLAVFGSKATRGRPGTLPSGSPLVRVLSLVVFGSAMVRVKDE